MIRRLASIPTRALVAIVDACLRASARWRWSAQAAAFYEDLRGDPSKLAAFAISCLSSTTGLVVFVMSRTVSSNTFVWWATAGVYVVVLALLYFAAAVVIECLFIRQSHDPVRFLDRWQRVVFFPPWQRFEPRYLSDLRASVITWSFVHWLQPAALVAAYVMGRSVVDFTLAAAALSYGTVLALVALTYMGALEIGFLVNPRRRAKGVEVEHLTMRIDFVEADRHRLDPWRLGPGVRAYKKFLGHELRNVLLFEGSEAVISAARPIEARDLELTLAVDDAPGDFPEREYRERTTIGDVTVLFDGEPVFHQTLRALGEGWNDYTGLAKSTPSQTVREIRFQKTGDVPVYFGVPRVIERSSAVLGAPSRRTIILLVIDSLRKDMVGLYRDGSTGTPNIDRFFGSHSRYTDAYGQGEWTKPIFASILTGLYSSRHRVTNHWYNHARLPAEIETFPEVLQRNRFHTFAYVTGGRASQEFNFDRGFDRFIFRNGHRPGEVSHVDITRRLLQELYEHADENRFLLALYNDLHFPFTFTSPFATKGTSRMERSWHDIFVDGARGRIGHDADYFVTLYRNKLHELDYFLNTLFAQIENSAAADTTAVIVTADHGVGFPTDGPARWLAKGLSDPLSNVPLLMRVPWRPDMHGRTFRGLVEASIDLYPTILELAGLPPTAPGHSRSLLPRSDGEGIGKEYAISESIFDGEYQGRIRTDEEEYTRHFSWRTAARGESVASRNGQPDRPRDTAASVEAFNAVVRERGLAQPEDDPGLY